MNPITDMEFDAEAIAAGIARWAAVESPSYDSDAVNCMMDEAVAVMDNLGANITRYDGGGQFGDIVRAQFPWGMGPAFLFLVILIRSTTWVLRMASCPCDVTATDFTVRGSLI